MDSQERQDGDVILEDLVLQGAGLLSRKVAPPAEINKDNRRGCSTLSFTQAWSNGCIMKEKKLLGVFRLHCLIDIYSSSLIILLLTMKHVNFARSCLRIT
ncbi:unnamed protein product [Urochloa humidicola]